MLISLTTLLTTLCSIFRSRAALELENLALRHQIGVLQRSVRKRPKLTSGDRLFWICLSHLWRNWRSALAIVKPETVIAWHRAGFRLFWTWKVRRGQPGRPVILRGVRDLIRKMCWENPGWGAPRIHGELLKLGINLGESLRGASDWFHPARVPRSCDRVPRNLAPSNPGFVSRLLSPIENASLVGEGLARATTHAAAGNGVSRGRAAGRWTAPPLRPTGRLKEPE